MRTIVIARFNEDVTWLNQVPKDWRVLIINKGDLIIPFPNQPIYVRPNVGREAESIVFFITQMWHALQGDYVFCQGNPFDHDPNFLRHIEESDQRHYGFLETSLPSGQPRCEWAMLHEYCKVFGLPVLEGYEFVAGAQFRVSAEQIKTRPLAFYEALHALTKLDNYSAWSLERLWPIIFNLPLK